ncbi:MAG: hypothetical protein J5374_10650 [Bacteroidales bacterium]|nr:hypothetical protein [Bacteroidales bacterium]
MNKKGQSLSNAIDTVNLPRHRWYYYKEGFSPNLVNNAIRELNLTNRDLVIDPFNGSGTVTLTCALEGLPSIGIEVNPFTAFIAKTKTHNVDEKVLSQCAQQLLHAIEQNQTTVSRWIGISTFTEHDHLEKWLFNREVADAYESGFVYLDEIENQEVKDILKLALISSLMGCANARRDGKCFKYRNNWKEDGLNKKSFLKILTDKLQLCIEDAATEIKEAPTIISADSRTYLENSFNDKFSLCITSPPYLNTFDYTDIYRPELFMGGFIHNNEELYRLRLNTVRSHVQAAWPNPKELEFGEHYTRIMKHILNHQDQLMCKRIPLMIQAYFEDMQQVLRSLYVQAMENAQIWIVVSTSAYAGIEVPVDRIIGDIGKSVGFELKRVSKMRDIRKRKTKYSGNIDLLHESLVILKR